MTAPFTSDRTWSFSVPPERLWSAIASTHEYRRWWPWLRRFDGDGLRQGARWVCRVQPPLPYSLVFTVAFVVVEEGRLAKVIVGGDIEGAAFLEVGPDPGGSRARLVSSLQPGGPVLRAVAQVARPMVRWGHDWVLDQGARQFVHRALS